MELINQLKGAIMSDQPITDIPVTPESIVTVKTEKRIAVALTLKPATKDKLSQLIWKLKLKSIGKVIDYLVEKEPLE